MFNKTPLESFHQTWHVKKKKKVPQNPKGAPAVYLILLCGAIRRTGAERATEWRKWRIHYLAKGANSRAEMDPPWAFFFLFFFFFRSGKHKTMASSGYAREGPEREEVTLGHLARCYLQHRTGWTGVLFDPLPYTPHLAAWAVPGDKTTTFLFFIQSAVIVAIIGRYFLRPATAPCPFSCVTRRPTPLSPFM